MALRQTRAVLALKSTKPVLSAYGPWDFRQFGEATRNFNFRELHQGYQAHGAMQFGADWMGNPNWHNLSLAVKIQRCYGPMAFFWFIGWACYYFNLSVKSPGCPWSVDYDPSRERSF
eukprot:Rhum_TRINITY_DN18503_c0_g1::Rhum_TRINITY_DN18503_c0_g1_i1::g.167469::m.167469